MKVEKIIDLSDVKMPVMAALPILISGDNKEFLHEGTYDPKSQLTIEMSVDHSTCTRHDSIGLTYTKSDHGRDD